MYILNKIVGVIVNPLYVGLAIFVLSLFCAICRRGRIARLLFWVTLGWLWVWSLPATSRLVCATLEAPYLVDGRVPRLEDFPGANVIELHGGGMGFCEELGSKDAACEAETTNRHLKAYAEMWTNADRVWMAVRLWKAGKAPVIVVSGTGSRMSTGGLVQDFGVPTNAIIFVDSPRNTEEEAKSIARLFDCPGYSGAKAKPKVLVVTSAWHMKRTMLMYEKYAPNVVAIPAPCDFEGSMAAVKSVGIMDFVPNPLALFGNSVALHEWIGYWGYRLFR